MREIKFRAWDMRDDKWLTDYYIVPNGQVLIQYPTHEVNRSHTISLMQYTGLKDKNGVEIYEGDIVQSDGWDNMVVEYGIQEVDAFEGMGFNLWSFYDDDGNGYKANGKRLSSTYEVIGNIYENPELLEGGDK